MPNSKMKLKLWTYRADILLQILAVLIQLANCDFSVKNIEKTISEDFLLCRGCGNNLSNTNLIINNLISEEAKYAQNETLFGIKEVLVQEFENPLGLKFKVILVKDSECHSNSGWSNYSTWFKGYSYKSCFCPRCGSIVGWMFQNDDSIEKDKSSKDVFYALIVTSIVDEHFVDSLLIRERIFRE
uniref:CSON015424 protein n=1 Tax=Culicoides sonorensis TaxID=179676 RepID=A0A336LS51_CULSO